MKFQNEDGLVFSCYPSDEYDFNLSEDYSVFSATIILDNEHYILFSDHDLLKCIRRARNFTAKYKIPIKVYEVVSDPNKKYKFIKKFKYTYYDYLSYVRYLNKSSK